ncbi:MAG TPA: MBL fold metallo-hydrolase [Chloroflexota bacterium]|nr:MBL fold metallo-hydrolase [Chloroflexota bacterium]
MELTWHGWSCFRLKGKEASIVTDPYTLASPSSLQKLTPDIVTASDRQQADAQPAGPFKFITSPGEYEVKGVLITGSPFFSSNGKRTGTFFKIEMDDLVLCHLGQMKQPLSASQVEGLADVDVLFVPVAGEDESIDATKAVEMINLIEPRIIVPMHFEPSALGVAGTPVEKFCHEIGQTGVTPQAKLTVTKTSLPAEPLVVVLDPR